MMRRSLDGNDRQGDERAGHSEAAPFLA